MTESSSPEGRPFIPQASPLLSTVDEARHPNFHSRRLDRANHETPEIRVVQPTRENSVNYGSEERYDGGYRRPSPRPVSWGSMRTGGDGRRPGSPGVETIGRSSGGSGVPVTPVRARTPRMMPGARYHSYRGSFGDFKEAGFDDTQNEFRDSLQQTFEPGNFDPMGTGRSRMPVNNPLDRDPTPPYETTSASSVGGRNNHKEYGRPDSRRSNRNNGIGGSERERIKELRAGTPSRRALEIQLERELGIAIKDPETAVAKTFVRPQLPLDLLDYPVIFHPRVGMHIAIMQPLYSGGGVVDGRLDIHIRGTRLDNIRLGRVSIDIAGVEELSFSRKTMFMSIATELIDEDHPPPTAMLQPADNDDKYFWKIKPSRSFIPFRMHIPLNVGPGPFHSVRARIRYVIHGTIMLTINGSKSLVRCSRDIRIISALDPETALLPLEVPLLSTEEHALRWGGHRTLKVTAGIHRAVWISGTAAYVDVNIINNTNRRINKIKCKLRRHILAYKNTVALAEGKSAGHLRVPSWIEKKTLSHSELNVGSRWKGVKGSQLDVVTCEIDIPRNQLSVKMGRFFEVKYLVDIAVCALGARPVHVQVPVTIVHMNSLDILPNDLPAVITAISARYPNQNTHPLPGRAFSAPREHTTRTSGLQKPLIPTQAPLQPRKSSLRARTSISRERSRSRSRGRSRNRDTNARPRAEEYLREVEKGLIQLDDKVNFDLESFTLGGHQDPRTATPARQQMIWDEMQNETRRRSSVASRTSNGLSNLDIMRQLAALKE